MSAVSISEKHEPQTKDPLLAQVMAAVDQREQEEGNEVFGVPDKIMGPDTGMNYMGLPYRGPRIDIKEEDPDNRKPKLQHTAHVNQFNLADPQQLAQYETICQQICNGVAIVSFEEKVYDNDIKSWRVLLRWMELYFVAPDERT